MSRDHYRTQVAELVSVIDKACKIIETADARLLTIDGPCGDMPPDMTLEEWHELYKLLDDARTY